MLNGCSRTGNQCAALLQGDIRGCTISVHLQSALLINGGIPGHTPVLTICQPSLFTTVSDAVPPLCTYWYPHSAWYPVRDHVQSGRRKHKPQWYLPFLQFSQSGDRFIDGCAYGIPANKLPGITVFCIRSPSAPVLTTVSVATVPGLTTCQPLSLMTVPVAIAPHASTVRHHSAWCSLPSLKALSASGTDNRV